MITVILVNHSAFEQNFMAEILTEQDDQNFEIISADSSAPLNEILSQCDGKYIWILPRGHAPAQTQTIKKIKKLLYFQSPDIIVGHFVARVRNQRFFYKQTSGQKLKNLLPSTLFYNKKFLLSLPEHITFDTLQMNAELFMRTMVYTTFPISDTSEITTTYRFQQSASPALILPWRFIKSAFTCCGKGLLDPTTRLIS